MTDKCLRVVGYIYSSLLHIVLEMPFPYRFGGCHLVHGNCGLSSRSPACFPQTTRIKTAHQVSLLTHFASSDVHLRFDMY